MSVEVTKSMLLELNFRAIDEEIYLHEDKKIIIIITKNYNINIANNYENFRVIKLDNEIFKNKEEIIFSRLNSILGNNTTIFARKTKVKRIEKMEAQLFLNQNHQLGYSNEYYKLGLYHQNDLVAVALFSKSYLLKNEKPPVRSYILVRYASKLNTNIVGGISKLLQHFIQLKEAKHIMTYTEKNWGLSNSYAKLGFIKVENYIDKHNKNHSQNEKWILKIV